MSNKKKLVQLFITVKQVARAESVPCDNAALLGTAVSVDIIHL